MRLIRIPLKALLVVCMAACVWAALDGGPMRAATACAGEEWKAEFDDVCSKTQDAMSYSTDELKALVARCDKIKAEIDKLEGAQKKVYTKRLQMCRDLIVFALESKETKQ